MNAAERLTALLKRQIGLDPASVGQSMIERVLDTRARRLAGGDANAYVARLAADPAEFQAFVDAIVVPETWFFRYPESMTALADLALARSAERAGLPLRILSLPCSTGEEPYTIAIALLDAGLAPEQFVIDAADISVANLQTANAARYGRNSFRSASMSFRDRHFQADGNEFVLSEAVRDRVRFHLGNLLDPNLALHAGQYDLVFCRNLLIYFDTTDQNRSVEILCRLARPDGVLFVGPAEASVLTRLRHRSLAVPMAFAFHATPDAAPAVLPASAALPFSAVPLTQALHRAPLPRPRSVFSAPPAPAPVAPPTVGAASESAQSLAKIGQLADLGQVEDGLRACQRHIQQFGPSAAAFYLQGLFHDAARRPQDAKDAYRKTLYLEPRHPQALLQLAALFEAEGDMAAADRLRRRGARRGTA